MEHIIEIPDGVAKSQICVLYASKDCPKDKKAGSKGRQLEVLLIINGSELSSIILNYMSQQFMPVTLQLFGICLNLESMKMEHRFKSILFRTYFTMSSANLS